LYNRRRMRELLEQESARVARSGEPIAVILTDIDHFKQFNDTFGHLCGDMILQTIADMLANRLRRTDAIARWGGEEVLILLPATEREDAIAIAEGLRREIAHHAFTYGGLKLNVTMTFGVAIGLGIDALDDLLHCADAMLYDGKSLGRNRVLCGEV